MPSEDSVQLVEIFLRRYEQALLHYGNQLDAVEVHAQERRERTPEDRNLAIPGLYSRQAQYLRDVLDLFVDALEDDGFKTKTVEERIIVQETFSHAIAVLNMMLDEEKAIDQRVKRGTDPEKLADKYRRKHFIPDGDPLDEDVARRITRTSKQRRVEHAGLVHEIEGVTTMKSALEEIRGSVFPLRPGRRQGMAIYD